MTGTHVVFTAAGHRFALPIGDVRKVRPLGRVTRIPQTPAHVAGAMNDEGTVVAIIDVAARLGAGPSRSGDPWVVFLDAPHPPVGLLVDDVEDVVALAPDEAAPPAPPDLHGFALTRLVSITPVATREEERGAASFDDAQWTRYTLDQSARLMGFQPLPPRSEDTPSPRAGSGQWLLDARRLLEAP